MTDVRRFKVHAHERIFIHNDLSNAAFHFKRLIESKSAKGDHSGLGLEVMAGATMLAFANEARFNFLGYHLEGNSWDEWKPAMKKVRRVFEILGISPDFSDPPYLYLQALKDFRDTLAHGKPEYKEFKEELEATEEELLGMLDLKADWERSLEPSFFCEAYDASEKIWKELLQKSGLTLMDTLSEGGSHIELIHEKKQ
ncbi:hypothetical protein [Roseibium sp. SCP14]|uniref:hypothetical protein n=1 Tax=Roseibium sp. SCP14 TaxID=3141375 RepID=UPI00333D8280